MNYTDIDQYELYYPTKVGCSQDDKDNEYAELLNKITESPRVAVVNICNNSDGSFHTLGFIPLDTDACDDPSDSDIVDYIRDEATFESEAGRDYDPAKIFDDSDYSIEYYDTTSDLQKITDYLDCIYATENLDVTVTSTYDETDESFCNTIKELNRNLYVALAGDPQDDFELIIIAAEKVDDANVKSIDNLPILFSDIFRDAEFSNIGDIKTDLNVIEDMHYTGNDMYTDLEDCLRSKFGDDWYDDKSGNSSNNDNDSDADEGPSEGTEPEERPVERLEITTPKYKATAGVKKVEVRSERKNIPSTRVNNKTKTNFNLKETNKMSLFAKLNFQPKNAAITFDGLLAIDVQTDPKLETKYKAIDKDENVIEVMDETIAMEMPLLMPVMGKNPEVGDYVCQGDTWYKILADKSALNLNNGTVTGLKMSFTQFFKTSVFYRAMINPSNMMSNGLMMAMLLNGENGEGKGNFDMKSLMLLNMMNGQNQEFMKNPMFMLFLMGDQGKGGFDMKTLAMMSMFNGGQNPFAGFLGSPVDAAEEAEAPAAPAKTGKRK